MQEEKLQTCKNLSDALHMSGMTRSEFARAAGVTEASISRYLSGKTEPRSAELLRMARALCVTVDWLLTRRESVVAASSRILRRNAADSTDQEDFDERTGDVAVLQNEIVALRNEVARLRSRLQAIGRLVSDEAVPE